MVVITIAIVKENAQKNTISSGKNIYIGMKDACIPSPKKSCLSVGSPGFVASMKNALTSGTSSKSNIFTILSR